MTSRRTWTSLLAIVLCSLLLSIGLAKAQGLPKIEPATSNADLGNAFLSVQMPIRQPLQVSFSYLPANWIDNWMEGIDQSASERKALDDEQSLLKEPTLSQLTALIQTTLNCHSETFETVSSQALLGAQTKLVGTCQQEALTGWSRTEQIDFAPLIELLKSEPQFGTLDVSLELPNADFLEVLPASVAAEPREDTAFWQRRHRFVRYSTEIGVGDLEAAQLSYRYRIDPVGVAVRSLSEAFFLFVPCLTIIWWRAHALKVAPNRSETLAWINFDTSYFRSGGSFIRLVISSVAIVGVLSLDAPIWLSLLPPLATRPQLLSIISGVYFSVPFALWLLLIGGASPGRGSIGPVSFCKFLAKDVLAQAKFLIPGLILVVLPALANAEASGIAYVAIAYLLSPIVILLLQKTQGSYPQQMTTGELHDHAFQLASVNGAGLEQLYCLPCEKSSKKSSHLSPTISALLSQEQGSILLTEPLLKQFSKAEVNSIIARQLAILRRSNTSVLNQTGLAVTVDLFRSILLLIPLLLLNDGNGALWLWPLSALAVVTLDAGLAQHRILNADLEAIGITGNSQSAILSLWKLARLNKIPLQWGQLRNLVMVEPSIQRRVEAIADHYNLPDHEVLALAAQAETEESSSPAYHPSAYSLMPTDSLFSPRRRYWMSWQVLWTIGLSFPLIGVVLGRIIEQFPTVAWQLLGYGAVAALLVAVYFHLANVMPTWGFRSLQKSLGQRLKSEGFDLSHGTFVGLSPGSGRNLYEGNHSWDIGYLFLVGDRLCYVGEQTRFALSSSQVTQVSIYRDNDNLLKFSSLVIAWQDDYKNNRAFSFQLTEARSLQKTHKLAQSLQSKIEAWRTACVSSADANQGPINKLFATLGTLRPHPVHVQIPGHFGLISFCRVLLKQIGLTAAIFVLTGSLTVSFQLIAFLAVVILIGTVGFFTAASELDLLI